MSEVINGCYGWRALFVPLMFRGGSSDKIYLVVSYGTESSSLCEVFWGKPLGPWKREAKTRGSRRHCDIAMEILVYNTKKGYRKAERGIDSQTDCYLNRVQKVVSELRCIDFLNGKKSAVLEFVGESNEHFDKGVSYLAFVGSDDTWLVYDRSGLASKLNADLFAPVEQPA